MGGLWQLLNSGADTAQSIPLTRFDTAELTTLINTDGFFMQNAQMFDSSLFRISPAESRSMDPQQRILLESCHSVLAVHSAQTSWSIDRDIGLFVGIMNTEDWMVQSNSPYMATGRGGAAAAGRVSFVLDLHGPCCNIETLCSSSLVALDVAYLNILLAQCLACVVSGVNLVLQPRTSIFLSTVGAMSPVGRCAFVLLVCE